MRTPYDLPEPDGLSKALAQKITALVVASAVTYKEAEDALYLAKELLMTQTRPVSLTVHDQDET